MQRWHGPLARPAGLPARLSGAGRTVGSGLRLQTERLTRSVRRVPGRYGPVARASAPEMALLKVGHHWVVDADPHERLLALVKARVADGRVLALVESFLQAGVLEEAKGWQPTECGTPQGGVISPLLTNLYLDPFDHQMARAGWELVRYADDFVLLCRSEAEAQAALSQVRAWVDEAGLTLHPEKTRIVDATWSMLLPLGRR